MAKSDSDYEDEGPQPEDWYGQEQPQSRDHWPRDDGQYWGWNQAWDRPQQNQSTTCHTENGWQYGWDWSGVGTEIDMYTAWAEEETKKWEASAAMEPPYSKARTSERPVDNDPPTTSRVPPP